MEVALLLGRIRNGGSVRLTALFTCLTKNETALMVVLFFFEDGKSYTILKNQTLAGRCVFSIANIRLIEHLCCCDEELLKLFQNNFPMLLPG